MLTVAASLCGFVYAERATDPLHCPGIDPEPLSYLAHALSAPRRLQGGQDSRFQLRG